MPESAYARAQYGSASGSLFTSAAVPIPCEELAVARPLVIGSLKPNALSSGTHTAPPTRPDSTTTARVIGRRSPSPSSAAMGTASAAVTDLGTAALVSPGSSPVSLPASAVLNMEKALAARVHPMISTACFFITLRSSKMRKPKERITHPRKAMRRSPPPAAALPLVRYAASVSMYGAPLSNASTPHAAFATTAVVMSGCTAFCTPAGTTHTPTSRPATVAAAMYTAAPAVA
mmetsp:Transcript_17615/g.60207  ORF Transcript_17615/g.60207 Transcript_17615/m.60207 type:complete len:232 (-) Transcript_17615:801-1496(-)